jgi:hypothetical protein
MEPIAPVESLQVINLGDGYTVLCTVMDFLTNQAGKKLRMD